MAGGNALGGAGPLVIGEEEDLVALDGAAGRAAKLILPECRLGQIEVPLGIERCVAEKLEAIAMKLVASRFGDDGDHAAIVVSVLGVEVVGQYAEFFDRIEVGNNGSAAVHMFLHIDAIHHESIRGFALAVDGEIAGILIARRIYAAGRARHDDRTRQQRRDRRHSRLNRQQIRVASSIQRQ